MKTQKILVLLAAVGLAVWYFFFKKDAQGNTRAKLPFDLTPRPSNNNTAVNLPHPNASNRTNQQTAWQGVQQAVATGSTTVGGVTIDITKPLSALGSWIGGLFTGRPGERPDDPLPSQDDEDDGYGAGTLDRGDASLYGGLA